MAGSSSTLILAVVQAEDAPAFLGALNEAGCGATHVAARGGFLRHHSAAVLVHVPNERTPTVIRAARATCSKRTAFITPVAEADLGYLPEPIEVEIGGAVIFGLAATSVSQLAALAPAGRVVAARPVATGSAPVTEPVNRAEEVAMLDQTPTKLLIAVVPDRAAGRVVAVLTEHRFGATTVGSTGGFLRRGNTTILTGVPADQAEAAAELIQTAVRQGGDGETDGGIAFALPVEWRLRL